MADFAEFTAPPDSLPGPAGQEVHVWKGDLSLSHAVLGRIGTLLDAEERDRANRFVFDRDRFFFTAGRGILRLLLGRYLNCDPATVRFFYNREGRPFLENPRGDERGPLFFNLSHSRGHAVFAFSREKEAGIDLEIPRDNIDFLGIADFFREPEARYLRETPGDRLAVEFLRLWTGKEAVLKAIGTGLAMELSSLEIKAGPEGLEPLLVRDSAEEAGHWRIFELNPWPEGRCSLAVRRSTPMELRLFALDETWINQATAQD